MPPLSLSSDQNSSHEDYPPLTDHDVEILYQIITTAEQSPDIEKLPFRAIFSAYDDVLAQNGLDPDHDQIYLRFLFRLGDRKIPSRSLYESFESLLEEFGIQIEFNSEEDGVHEITRDISAENRAEHDTETQLKHSGRSHTNIRRASFHSLYDIENEGIGRRLSRGQSQASSPEPPNIQSPFSQERPATRASTRSTERVAHRPSRPQSPIGLSERSRLTTQDFTNIPESNDTANRIHRVFFQNNDVEYSIDQAPGADLNTSADDDTTRKRIQTIIIPNGIKSASTTGGEALIYRPSETQLLRDVATFEYYRIKAIARNLLRKWYHVAQRASQNRKKMGITATGRNVRILVRQCFDRWRTTYRARKHIAETEKFFYHLERRAVKARDLFLLTKAFTHWAECAREQVLHTSLARRHVLSLRHFNAWRQITVLNELKLRRQVLWKFTGIWKQGYIRNKIHEETAIAYHHGSLKKTALWRWFWMFYQKRALQLKFTQLKNKYVNIWVLRLQAKLQQEQGVSFRKLDGLKRAIFSQWLAKARLAVSSSKEAARFGRLKLAAHSFREWRLSLRHRPLVQQISNAIDWRIAGAAFATFVYRFRVERYAEEINRRRIKRRAWTQWNDLLRCRTLAQQIDDRFLLEALYKWVIAERLILLQRLNRLRLKKRIFSRAIDRFRSTQIQRDRNCEIFQHTRDIKILNLVFAHWRLCLESHRRDEQRAIVHYKPRIAQKALQVWNTKHAHIQRLTRWAKDARFYFLVTKFLKRWQAAVVESKRLKRRDAYVLVRRQLKMSLVRKSIRLWHDLASRLKDLKDQSQNLNEARLLRVSTALFDKWITRWDSAMDRSQNANNIYQRKLATLYFQFWLEQLRAHQELQARAQRFANSRVERLAFGSLHKLRLQMIELHGGARKAESLRSLHERRHHHNLLRTWYAKTAARRGLPHRDTLFSSRRPNRFGVRPDVIVEDPPAASRAEEWTAFEDGFDLKDWMPSLEAQTSATPLPSHLATPSKRPARLPRNAVASGPAIDDRTTTPVGTPFHPVTTAPRDRDLPPLAELSPPPPPPQAFRTPGSQSRRRIVVGTGSGLSLSSRFARASAGLKGSMFRAIPEGEPRTPGP